MNAWRIGGCIFIVLAVVFCVWFGMTPGGRETWNRWMFGIQKADDATRYQTLKKVEDTCRAMMASYTTDKLTYEQYCDSENAEQRGWADQAKMRANKTAATYNEYVIKNSFVWEDNIPPDIYRTLEYIK